MKGACLNTALTSSGQVSAAGIAAWCVGFQMSSDTLAATLALNNGASGAALGTWVMGSTTAEHDNVLVVRFPGRGIPFSADIYATMTNCPRINVQFVPME